MVCLFPNGWEKSETTLLLTYILLSTLLRSGLPLYKMPVLNSQTACVALSAKDLQISLIANMRTPLWLSVLFLLYARTPHFLLAYRPMIARVLYTQVGYTLLPYIIEAANCISHADSNADVKKCLLQLFKEGKKSTSSNAKDNQFFSKSQEL